jgi:phage terminase large subunit-like protein
VIQTLRGRVPGLIAVPGNDDKVARAHGVSWFVEAGNVFLPDPKAYPTLKEHVEAFLLEAERYPRSTYTDQVIAFTQYLQRVTPYAQPAGAAAKVTPEDTALTEAASVANQSRW